jgi:hypothetical protein
LLTESELWNKLDKVVNALSEEASALNHLLEETTFLITLSPDELRYLELIRKQERLA